jgi:nucleoid-associated protein YgaU
MPTTDTTRALSALIRLFFAGGGRQLIEFEAAVRIGTASTGDDKGEELSGGKDKLEPIFLLI